MNKALTIGGAAVLAWGLLEPYVLDKPQYEVQMPNLPPELDGQRVAVMGDFQIGMWLSNRRTVQRAISAAREARPAAVLLLGDFIYKLAQPDAPQITDVASLVEPLCQDGIPTYAVLGNHDYDLLWPSDEPQYDLAQALVAALERVGVVVLQNEAVALPGTNAGLYIVGLGSHYAANDFPELAFSRVPPAAARIVMMHHPASFAKIAPGCAPLAVAGHTHAGQLRLPFAPHWSYLSLLEKEVVQAGGWSRSSYGQPGNHLYVNRGIGFNLLPLRFNAPPELTFFSLRTATPGRTWQAAAEVPRRS